MAVYTQLSQQDIADFAAGYGLNDVTGVEGILEGVQNTNYRLQTVDGRYILTVFEKMTDTANLPFFMGLMAHMSARDVPCPKPLVNKAGEIIGTVGGKPGIIVTHLDGDWPRAGITTHHCAALGAVLAKMHVAATDFTEKRDNDLSLDGWQKLFDACGEKADTVQPGLAKIITDETTALRRDWPQGLPTGAVHTDLFPNNVFFKNETLSGVIDFYFAATDFYAYDLAICINAWCFDREQNFMQDRATALLSAYRDIRPLSPGEITALPVLARGAAMRFLATRLHDWLNTPKDALVEKLDPLEYARKLAFHQTVDSPTPYGLAA